MPVTDIHEKIVGHQASFPTKNGGTFLGDFVRMIQKRKKLVLIHLYLKHFMARVLFTYKNDWLYILSEKC